MTQPNDVAVIFVCYRTPSVDTGWIPHEASVLIVCNDETTPTVDHPSVQFLGDGTNIGFGAGVNIAARATTEGRLLICNPDARFAPSHFESLSAGAPDELVTVPIVDSVGTPTPVVNRFPGPLDHLLTGLRIGRLAPLGTRRRAILGAFSAVGRGQAAAGGLEIGRWSTRERWTSGAALSIAREAFLRAGGFDERFFLYFEDVEFGARLAAAGVGTIVVADVEPAVHLVGGSSEGSRTSLHRLDSAITYARHQGGPAWAMVAAVLRIRRELSRA